MKKCLALLAVVFCFSPALCPAQNLNQPIGQIGRLKSATPGESSAIWGDCSGTRNDREITCRFTQVLVSLAIDPKHLGAELQNIPAKVRELSKEPEQFAKELRDDQLCRGLLTSPAKLKEVRGARARDYLLELQQLCADPTPARLEALLRRQTVEASKECQISLHQNDSITFRKAAANRWVANVGPHGLCGSRYVYTLHHEPDHRNLWTFTQVRTATEGKGELCTGLEVGRKVEFSWKGDDPDLTCAFVTFAH
jgi:hypothetical protein